MSKIPLFAFRQTFPNDMVLIQERFILDSAFDVSSNSARWFIPVMVEYPLKSNLPGLGKPHQMFWMKNGTEETRFQIEEKPYLLNYEQKGFYR